MTTETSHTRQVAAAFWAGLVQTSRSGVVLMLMCAAIWLGLGAYLLSPSVLQHAEMGYLMENARDNDAYITLRAFQIREAGPPRDAAITVLGTSVLLNALLHENRAEQYFNAHSDTPYNVQHLSSPGLTQWDLSAMVDYLGHHTGQVVVIDISPMLLGRTLESEFWAQRRMGVGSDALEEEIAIAGGEKRFRTGIYPLDQREFFSARLKIALKRLVYNRPILPERMDRMVKPDKTYETTLNSKNARERFNLQLRRMQKNLNYPDIYKDNLEHLGRLMARRRALGKTIFVLVEAPRHPKLERKVDAQQLQRYQQLVKSFANEHDVHYWDLTQTIKPKVSEMRDLIHVSNPAVRIRFTRELMQRIARVVRQGEQP